MSESALEHFDVLVVGAGISGVNAAYRLQTRCPKKTFAILEGRAAIGGTWDLFRFPGIRSDSDMFTLGFPFRPWDGEKAIADGASIREYIQTTARVHGIDEKVRFGHRVERATWSTDTARWTVEVLRTDGTRVELTCHFLFMCTGYYDYAGGYTPAFPGAERFKGQVVHPQTWTDDVVHAGKRVVVIGSGATAVGLVPALAKEADHVTMLQRSPTYMMSFPSVDGMSRALYARLPQGIASGIMRARNVALGKVVYGFSRRWPAKAKKMFIDGVRKRTPSGYDVDTHFTPRYAPWDQRLCLVRDGDLFAAIREGTVDVVTDEIETFTENGIKLRSGRELAADVIVTATGLNLQLLAGVPLVVDDKPIELPSTTMYKGAMLSDVPNFALSLGYINASWTLRSDLVCQYVCRVLDTMDRGGYRICTPHREDNGDFSDEAVMPLASGYVQRALGTLPRQGTKRPWKNVQGYLGDVVAFRYASVADGALRLER